ncbi:hypothetical protein VPH35_123417 [Triticum aestivum]
MSHPSPCRHHSPHRDPKLANQRILLVLFFLGIPPDPLTCLLLESPSTRSKSFEQPTSSINPPQEGDWSPASHDPCSSQAPAEPDIDLQASPLRPASSTTSHRCLVSSAAGDQGQQAAVPLRLLLPSLLTLILPIRPLPANNSSTRGPARSATGVPALATRIFTPPLSIPFLYLSCSLL